MDMSQFLSKIKSPITDEKIIDLIKKMVALDGDVLVMYRTIVSNVEMNHNEYTEPCYRELEEKYPKIVESDRKFWYYIRREWKNDAPLKERHDFKPDFRIYLNLKGKDKTDFAKEFVEKQVAKDKRFILKFSMQDGRDDEVVIGCSREDLLEDIEIIEQMTAHKCLYKLPELVGSYNGNIGISEEYKESRVNSYTSLRLFMLPMALEKYLLDHYESVFEKCSVEEKEIMEKMKETFNEEKSYLDGKKQWCEDNDKEFWNLNEYDAIHHNIYISLFRYYSSVSQIENPIFKKVICDEYALHEIADNYRMVLKYFGFSENGVLKLESEKLIGNQHRADNTGTEYTAKEIGTAVMDRTSERDMKAVMQVMVGDNDKTEPISKE